MGTLMGLILDTLVGKDNTSLLEMMMPRFGSFLLLATVTTFIRAAPQKRAAMDFESVCASAAEAYSKAKAEGKPAKRAAAISAKTFFENVYDTFSSTGFPSGGLSRCPNAVDAVQGRSTAGMVAYFTPPPMPTSRCSPPSAGSPPSPTSRQRLPGRSRARQRLRRLLPISKLLMNTGTTDLP